MSSKRAMKQAQKQAMQSIVVTSLPINLKSTEKI